ncbi:Gfo/Idh/MocA family oxidoreductase [uncultured Maribacter sp.]|uniref:Gfo/Idh/MocA family protein n=1 Tax=uncultured Maribacter sp. TaxID=431308 RepID=UPI002639BA88|nr:Gfo/Idh/MocA family oxidoreductase [uncultured Maribacter sp.]
MIKWGILGPGNIAKKFASDLRLVPNALLSAVASRDLDKAENFAREYSAERAYGSYQELFDDKEVQVIYIATPHNKHVDLSVKAMNHGKHVLCEKPLGVNAKEVKAMVAASKKNNVFLMEGLWSRFNPAIKKVKQLVDNGEIGKLSYLYANFAFYGTEREKDSRLLNPDLAGGSLLDIGIYPVFLAYLFLGKPQSILATSNFYETGVEVQTSMIFKYENAQAMLYSGLTSNSQTIAEFSGSVGSIVIPERWHAAQGYTMQIEENLETVSLPTKGIGFSHEIEEVQHCIIDNKMESNLWTHVNSIELAELLDSIRAKIGVVFPFEE